MVNKPLNTEWIECNKCLRPTKHDVLAEHVIEDSDEIEGDIFSWTFTHQLLMCCGCESVSYRLQCTGDAYDDVEETYYPPRISRQLPRWYRDLPRLIRSLMRECYNALHNDNRRLAVMGARTLVDLFMNETIGDAGGFKDKLKILVDQGYIGTKDKGILESALDVGHAAIHRGHEPESEEINTVFDIVESLLQKLILMHS